VKLLFTGFGAFGAHSFNPSSIVAEEAAEASGGVFRLLAVDFYTAYETGKCSTGFDCVIHVGLAAATQCIQLERFAHNLRMQAEDPGQENDPDAVVTLSPGGTLALETTFPVAKLRRRLSENWDIRHSRDAGTYVCNATYYWSLRNSSEARVLLVHVPAWAHAQARAFGQALGESVQAVLKEEAG
jgi:pyroglutamyl-peptidase